MKNLNIINMKWILMLALAYLMSNCNNASKEQTSIQNNTIKSVLQADTLKIDTQIISFEAIYDSIIKEIGDSVSRIKEDWGDYSEFTTPLKLKYEACDDPYIKTFMGYKLAKNYMIHYDGLRTHNIGYKQMAEPLFVSFISFNDGELASRYLKLSIKKVHFMQNHWDEFSEKDKETLLFYGLLRGFERGLPEVLENAKER